MRSLHEHWLWIWDWLTKQGASRATVLLVFITAVYAWLTYRMAKAMNRQTRAQVQPILEIDILVSKEEFYPIESFTVRNVGSQPALIRHMRMTCHRDRHEEHDEYMMYERHLMPPNDELRFAFDFSKRFIDRGFRTWSPGWCAFNLWVVASDLSGDITLTYIKNQSYGTLRVSNGMPWFTRRKFVRDYFSQRYYRILYKFKKPSLFVKSRLNGTTRRRYLRRTIPMSQTWGLSRVSD